MLSSILSIGVFVCSNVLFANLCLLFQIHKVNFVVVYYFFSKCIEGEIKREKTSIQFKKKCFCLSDVQWFCTFCVHHKHVISKKGSYIMMVFMIVNHEQMTLTSFKNPCIGLIWIPSCWQFVFTTYLPFILSYIFISLMRTVQMARDLYTGLSHFVLLLFFVWKYLIA